MPDAIPLRNRLRRTQDNSRWLSLGGLHALAQTVWDGMAPAIEALCNTEPQVPTPPAAANRPASNQPTTPECDDRQHIRRNKSSRIDDRTTAWSETTPAARRVRARAGAQFVVRRRARAPSSSWPVAAR